MCRREGFAFTLAELLVVLAVIALLASVLVPSLTRAREQARQAACAVKMRNVGVALKQYAAGHMRYPPFAFSDQTGNLPLSGHWGGASQDADPGCFGRPGVDRKKELNLWLLLAGKYLPASELVCPGADSSVLAGAAGYFPYTTWFSTYCLRVPYSADVFAEAPWLANYRGLGLLGVYLAAAGGTPFPDITPYGTITVRPPLIRMDICYAEAPPGGEVRLFDPMTGAVLSDAFWYQRQCSAGGGSPTLQAYEVNASWCHGEAFNVLFGDGSVRAIRDDGTIRANSAPPGLTPPGDGAHHATRALRVWRHFENSR